MCRPAAPGLHSESLPFFQEFIENAILWIIGISDLLKFLKYNCAPKCYGHHNGLRRQSLFRPFLVAHGASLHDRGVYDVVTMALANKGRDLKNNYKD
jgi:hypothetical protein